MTRQARISATYVPVEFDGRRTGHVHMDEIGTRDEWELHPDDPTGAAPGLMLFVTPRTEHRPYVPPDGWDPRD